MYEVPLGDPISTSGLRLISQHEGVARKQSVLCANGLMEVVPDLPFTMMMRNFTNAPHRLPKHMKIAWAEPPPDYYVPLLETVRTEATIDAVTTVQSDELRFSKRQSACLQSYVTQSQRKRSKTRGTGTK